MPTHLPAASTFRDLIVWRKAHEFVLAIYTLTARFPKHETYGLSTQMRRPVI
jgi:four helix bundle protein